MRMHEPCTCPRAETETLAQSKNRRARHSNLPDTGLQTYSKPARAISAFTAILCSTLNEVSAFSSAALSRGMPSSPPLLANNAMVVTDSVFLRVRSASAFSSVFCFSSSAIRCAVIACDACCSDLVSRAPPPVVFRRGCARSCRRFVDGRHNSIDLGVQSLELLLHLRQQCAQSCGNVCHSFCACRQLSRCGLVLFHSFPQEKSRLPAGCSSCPPIPNPLLSRKPHPANLTTNPGPHGHARVGPCAGSDSRHYRGLLIKSLPSSSRPVISTHVR